MRRWVMAIVLIAAALAVVPPALIVRARLKQKSSPRIHLLQDMDNQPKYKTQAADPMFADDRAMRPPVEGTLAQGDLAQDPAYYRGVTRDTWAEDQEPPWVKAIPTEITRDDIERGRQRYDIFCATCHGLTGQGGGPIALRADELMAAGEQDVTWTPPVSLQSETVRERPDGHLFNTITNGIRSMPAYGTQIPVEDRWRIVAYVRALQRSSQGKVDDVPAEHREALK